MSDFSYFELERYARHIVLPQVGGVGQRRLSRAKVAVLGAGGIGSAAIPALAGAGVGSITIIDDGLVDRSNLQRQTMFRDDQIGRPKAELAAQYAAALNPDIEVRAIADRLVAGNAEPMIAGHDLIVDGCDNFASRLVVGDAATRLQVPLVSAAAIQLQGQIGLFRGWEPGKPCYRCFVGDAFDADDCDTCAEDGMLGAMAGWAGTFAALQAVRLLLSGKAAFGDPQYGKLHLLDGGKPAMRTLNLAKDPACRACGTSPAE